MSDLQNYLSEEKMINLLQKMQNDAIRAHQTIRKISSENLTLKNELRLKNEKYAKAMNKIKQNQYKNNDNNNKRNKRKGK